MQRCIDLAYMGLGHTYPNPLVGCVIVYNNQIIGEGYHQKAGQPHAEVNAINSVKDKSLLSKSTLYVNLEPCSHFGKTPPCADLIVKHNIPKVVIGTQDPFSEVAGRGIEKLKNNGCEVIVGVLENECNELNKRFFTFHQKKRPFIILKWSQSPDGFISPERKPSKNPQPFWISNETSKILVHKWRTEEQSIMIGTNTAMLDNPILNSRDWSGNNPVRIVVDENLILGNNLNLFDNSIKTLIFNKIENKTSENQLTEFIKIDFNSDIITAILDVLYQKQIQSLIVEGGSYLLNSFFNADLWDEIRVSSGESFLKKGIRAPEIKGKFVSMKKINSNKLYVYKNSN